MSEQATSRNLFARFTGDSVEASLKDLKATLLIALIEIIREKGWTQAHAAKELNISAPRMSNVFRGHLEKFSIGALVEMLFLAGYRVEATSNDRHSIVLKLTIATEGEGNE